MGRRGVEGGGFLGLDPPRSERLRESAPCLDLQIADTFQFRFDALHIECVLRKFTITLYPKQEKVRGPSVGIGLRSTVTQIRSAIQDCIARLHLDRGEGFITEILDARIFTDHSCGPDLERPWQAVAINERERHAVLA